MLEVHAIFLFARGWLSTVFLLMDHGADAFGGLGCFLGDHILLGDDC